jgi:hypothetical protein
MNFVLLSPHFPHHYHRFGVRLAELGATVLGLADEPYDRLEPALKSALKEYYRVQDMHSYDELLRALGHFTHRHGKIDRLDSHNEYWLEAEARLRTDFNIPGIGADEIDRIKRKSLMKAVFRKAGVAVARGRVEIDRIKRKSLMKAVFRKAGVAVARGRVVRTPAEARRLIAETGYPVVAKPDIGVGAAKTYKIASAGELEAFFAQKPPADYIMEEFISGQIFSFDGLADRAGNLVFFTSHCYSQGIMETVNNDDLIHYWSLREIPADLEAAGRATAKAFGVRERFFHFEFFRTPAGDLVALEVNMRPPGGLTTEMFNYANDIDVYREWANVIVSNRFAATFTRPYHCCYVGRKSNRRYAHSHEEVLAAFGGGRVCHHEPISGVFAAALGDHGYLVRSPELDEVFETVRYIQRLA